LAVIPQIFNAGSPAPTRHPAMLLKRFAFLCGIPCSHSSSRNALETLRVSVRDPLREGSRYFQGAPHRNIAG